MVISISEKNLYSLLVKQLSNLFFFSKKHDADDLDSAFPSTLKKLEKCFSNTTNIYYRKNNKTYFNPYHSSQYCIFLYYLSNMCSKSGAKDLADRIYFLNKALNAVDLYHEVNLPEVFYTDHPVGSVIGRASFSNHFSFTQNCTVGHNKGFSPHFGEHVHMYSGAKVIGKCSVADYCLISSGCCIKDTDIPCGSIVYGISPNLTIVQKDKEYILNRIKPTR
jgi:serine O-acetyltransferase